MIGPRPQWYAQAVARRRSPFRVCQVGPWCSCLCRPQSAGRRSACAPEPHASPPPWFRRRWWSLCCGSLFCWSRPCGSRVVRQCYCVLVYGVERAFALSARCVVIYTARRLSIRIVAGRFTTVFCLLFAMAASPRRCIRFAVADVWLGFVCAVHLWAPWSVEEFGVPARAYRSVCCAEDVLARCWDPQVVRL